MTTGELTLAGYVRPLPDVLGFAIPVFSDGENEYVQVLECERISGWRPIRTDADSPIVRPALMHSGIVGDPAVFAFEIENGMFVFGTREDVTDKLIQLLDNNATTIGVKQEILEFFKTKDQISLESSETSHNKTALVTLLEKIFKNSLGRLPEDLRKTDKIPMVVNLTAWGCGIPPDAAVRKMDERLSEEKKKWLDRELPWRSEDKQIIHKRSKEEYTLVKDSIDKEIDKLRARLVDVLREFPEIWDSCQEEIASIEPISDINRVFRGWSKEDGLQELVSRLRKSVSYETLCRYNHPLLEIEKLSTLLKEPRPDTEAIEQVLWTLLNGDGKPGAKTIKERLTKGLRRSFPELAELLAEATTNRSHELTSRSRCGIYRAVERLVANLPGGATKNLHFQVLDFAWRAVLLDKARALNEAAGLAGEALKLAGNLEPRINKFMWWSRLGDANRIVAKASEFTGHIGWTNSMVFYDKALEEAAAERKTLVYLRQAETLADRLALFGANPPADTATEMCRIAERGCEIARKAVESAADDNVVGPLYMEARLQALLASATGVVRADQAAAAEQKFMTAVDAVLQRNPRHWGAIRLAWHFYNEKRGEDSAIQWLDRQVERLRETHDTKNRKVADFLEFQAARDMLDFGQQDEARQRFQRMVTETQPGNPKAWREIVGIGLDPLQENLAQQLYEKARSQPVGSQNRKGFATEALKRNQHLVDADPGKKDAVPWTRHARLLLLIGGIDNIDNSIRILEELRAKDRGDPYVWFHLGEAYYRKGMEYESSNSSSPAQENYERATTAFESALRIEKRVDTAHRLAACWTRRQNVPEAKRMLLEAEKLDSADGWTKFSLGWAHYQVGELDQGLQKWVAALQCFGEAESLTEREETLARQTANAIVRFADEPMATEVSLENLGSSSLRMLASAASSAGWNRSKIVERMGHRLDSLPPHARRRVPHALRAHLLYMQLAKGNDDAYQWHKRWFESLAAVNNDNQLFFEYAAGAKGAFRRAVLWSLSRVMSADSHMSMPDKSDVVLDEQRWGNFLRVALTRGPQENYYRTAYEAWPTGHVSRDELWDVVRRLNAELFQAALNEVGLDLTQPALAKSLEVAEKLPLEIEILPAKELDLDAPTFSLVQTDEFSSRILLSVALDIVKQHAVSEVKKSWDMSGNLLRRSIYDGAPVLEAKVESLKFLASRSGGDVTTNKHGGLDLTWPIWSQNADSLLGEQSDSLQP